MGASVWARRPPPAPWPGPPATWPEQPATLAALPGLRRRLRAAIADGELPAGCDDGERLLLVVEELVSNALRHGRPPVTVTVTAPRLGWLVAVSDTAAGRPPVPALGRDPARGGMGLSLVARICGAHGWVAEDAAKVVWARVPYLELLRTDRAHRATDRARGLAERLVETADRTARTLDALAVQADSGGRTDVAGRCRSGARRARLEAERARWVVLTAPGPRSDARRTAPPPPPLGRTSSPVPGVL
ncbi:ATP-binding protein [Geodermatophilus sp. SYSU D01045]